MVREQVITIHFNGTMSGLQVKPGKGLDLRQFGPAKIVRASEIVWDEDAQFWTVVIQDAPGLEAIKGVAVTGKMADIAGLSMFLVEMAMTASVELVEDADAPLQFADYDDAVRFEIAFLDAYRLRGVY